MSNLSELYNNAKKKVDSAKEEQEKRNRKEDKYGYSSTSGIGSLYDLAMERVNQTKKDVSDGAADFNAFSRRMSQYGKNATDFGDMDWNRAKSDTLDSDIRKFSSEEQALKEKIPELRAYLDRNRFALGADYFDLKKYLDAADQSLAFSKQISDERDFINQFDTEGTYNAYNWKNKYKKNDDSEMDRAIRDPSVSQEEKEWINLYRNTDMDYLSSKSSEDLTKKRDQIQDQISVINRQLTQIEQSEGDYSSIMKSLLERQKELSDQLKTVSIAANLASREETVSGYNVYRAEDGFDESSKLGAMMQNPSMDALRQNDIANLGRLPEDQQYLSVNNELEFFIEHQNDDLNFDDTSMGAWANVVLAGRNKNWGEIHEDEREMYNYLLYTFGDESAQKYMDDLQVELDKRAYQKNEEAWRARYNDDETHLLEKIGMNAASVAGNVFGSPLAAASDLVGMATGNYNPYSRAHNAQNIASVIRDETSKEIVDSVIGNGGSELAAKLASNTYQAIMSGLDSFAGATTMGGAYTLTMGAGAASQRAKEMYEAGASEADIAVGSVASGILEALFEKVSLDYFFGNFMNSPFNGGKMIYNLKDFAKAIGKQAVKVGTQGFVEGSEEVATEISNIIFQAIQQGVSNSFESDSLKKMKEYQLQGYSEDEAKRKVLWENVEEVLWAGFGGFVSGGGMGALGSVSQGIMSDYDLSRAGSAIQYNGGTEGIVQSARDIPESVRNPGLMRLAESVASKENPSNRKVGKLYAGVQQANEESIAKAKETTFRREARKAFADSNPDASKAEIDNAADLLTKVMFSENVSAKDQRAYESINGDKLLSSVMKSGGYTDRAIEATRMNAVASSVRTQSRALGESVSEDKNTEYNVSEDHQTSVRMADGEEVKVEVTGVASVKNGTVMVKLSDGSTVNANRVSFGSEDDAKLYAAVADLNISAKDANELISGFKNSGVSADIYALGVKEAYRYGQYGVAFDQISKSGFAVELPESLRKSAYNLGSIYAITTAAEARKNAIIEGKYSENAYGKVYRKENGVIFNVDTRNRTLTEQQKGAIHVAKVLSAMGVRVHIFESEKGSKMNGFYSGRDGSIHIDLAAGDSRQGLMAYTLAHEFTHFIEKNAKSKFKTFADQLFQAVGKEGSVQAMIESRFQMVDADSSFAKLSKAQKYDIAYSEVVAEMCETMFTDTNALQKLSSQLKNTDNTLWGKIKSFFGEWIAKLKKAYAGMSPDSELAKIARDTLKNAENLQQLWVDAAAEAAQNYRQAAVEAEIAPASNVKESVYTKFGGKTPQNVQQEILASTRYNSEFMQKAEEENKKSNKVPTSVLQQAKKDRYAVAMKMRELQADKSIGLPEDILGNTYIANSSYDGTEENTTICPRSLASEAFMDAVSEYLGRPLTVAEQVYISQDLQGRSTTPECLYCYVATDRKAYREFLGSYIEQRDAVLKKISSKNSDTSRSGKIYQEFLDGRKDTKNMWKRFSMWVDAYRNGKKMISANDLANINKLMGDINSEFGEELKDQIKDAMAYAQSASWAKKRVSYLAYNGHILNWKQDRINKLNSHYGLRMYSFSDFHPAFILENMQMITDASVRGLKMLAYTKDTDFVKIFAGTGMNINVSVFGFESGGNVYENNIIGANWDEAKQLRSAHDNVGVTFVATNDNLVEWALSQDWIDVVIPYHLVRTGAEVASSLGYTNYTSESGDKKTSEWNRARDQKMIAPTEHNNDFDTYMSALKKNHLTPRFERWIGNPNYMKLVNECRRSASESTPVQPVFNMDSAMESLAKLEAHGYYTPIGGSIDRMYEIAAEVGEKIESGEASEGQKNNTAGSDMLYSIRNVAPVQPSSTEWKRGVTTEEAMKIYPNMWNVTADESEKRNPTQITSTVNTYNKIYDILKAEGFDGTILDASSGLGYGTRSGIENYGFQVDDIEPYPDKGYKPKYTDYSTLNKTYDAIISNAVLNVLPQDQRDALVVKMGEMLNPGGRMFINVRSLAEIQNLQKAIDKKTGKLKNVVISDSEVAETTKGSYQKGFRKSELVSYLKDALGDGYKVEPTNRFGGVSVIVTKDSALFSKRTADDRIYEREFMRLAKLYEKESDLNARLKKEAKRHKEDSATWEREFKRLMNEYNKVGRNVSKLQSELDSRKEKYVESMAKYRQRAEMELKEQSQRYQESRKMATERRHNTETRHSIEKILHDMDKRMNHPVDGKYVPKPLRSAVAEVLSSIDRSSGREGKAAYSLQKLVTQYREMAKSNSVGMAMFDETVAEMLQTAASYNKPLREMNAEELGNVKKALKAMDHVIKKAVVIESFQIPGLSKEQNVFEFAKRMIRETAATGKQKRGKAYRYLLTQARPETALRWFGGYAQNSAWEAVYKGMNAAQKKSMNIQMDLGSGFNELANAKEASTLFDRKNLVDVGLVDENGNNVKITRGMMLSLYMHLLNDQNTRHVMTGGLTIPDMKEYYKGNIKQAYNDGVRVFGTSQEIAGVQSEIRELERQMEADGYDSSIENQIERLKERVNEIMDAGNAYMDSIRGRIEKLMSDYDVRIIEATQELYRKSQVYLNEATNTMYGFDKASVENYFPIVSDPDFLSAKFDSISADFNLENAGFMKERNNGANPILLSDIIGTNESQIKRTSQYAAFAPVVKDFNKVYSITEPGYTQSVQSVFSKQFGNEGKTYIEHLLADINGGGMAYKEISGIDVLLRKARGNMAASTLSLNPRVALSQAASLPTAAAELGYASVALSLTKSFKKADMKLIAKYSPLLWYRMQGNSTTEIGDMQKSTTARGKFDKATRWLTGWISSVDAWTVKRLWFASEYWVKSHTSLQEGSDAYYKAVAEKFDATVERTQPNYSTLQRSDVLRSKNEVTKMLTMFSTQRSQNFNILLDAALDFNYALKNKTGVKQAFQKYQLAISSQLVAAGTYVAVRFFADMLLHTVDAYRDDDDELTKESIQKELLNQFLSTLSGTTLFGSELYDAARAIITKEKYYPVSLSGIGSVIDASEDIVKALQNPSKSNLVKAAKGIATVRGIPLNNALKIVTGMSRHIEDFKNGAFGSMEAGVERTPAQQQRRWYRAIVNGDQMTADEIYDQMISDKMNTMKSDGTYPTEDEAKGSVYSAQKQILRQMDPRIKQAAKAQFDGDNEKRIRIAKEIIAEGNFPQDMVVTAITAELNALKSADSEYEFDPKAYSLYAVDDYVESILSGKYATASTEIMDDLVDAKMRNGMTMEEAEKSVETAAKKGLKTLYIENREIDQASAIDALQAITGDDFDDASGAVQDWFKDYIRDEFESGNLSESETIKELTGEGGLDEDSAYQKVTYWAFRKENPSMDWSEAQILKYNSDIKPTGITVQLYNDYLTERKKCTGVDSNGDGKTDSGSVKSQVLKVIDSMPITDEQKDALYRLNGWSENTIYKAPWH